MSKSFKKKWYVIQTFSGFEGRAVKSLKNHIKLNNMEKLFDEIIVPKEEVVEIKNGNRYKSERKFFPGYILIKMIMNEISWHFIKKINHIVGFVGGRSDCPLPIPKKEINFILNKLKKIENKPVPKIIFQPGELIRINTGPFSDFNGTVEKIDYDKNRLVVSVSIFGRPTPVELNFSQIEKC